VLTLLPLLGVWLIVVASPGPDFLVLVQQATGRSRRHGVMAALGINTGLLVWATGSMLGLSVLFARLSWLYDIVRYAGAAYLVYLGVRTLWAARRGRPAPVATPPAERQPGGLGRAWWIGFLTDIGNPKAAAFFGSLFGAMLPPGTSAGLRAVLVALIVGIATVWYLTMALLFGLRPVARIYQRARRWIDRVMAAVFIALGGRLALDR
jgi:threonine/homoserine/homoserine lactone efflux protein